MVVVRPTEPTELRRILRLTLAAPGAPWGQVERQIDGVLPYARQLNLDLTRSWVAVAGCEWLSGATYLECPGRTAMLFLTPGFDMAARRAACSEVVAEILANARSRSVRIVQCLLAPGTEPQPL